MQTPSFWQSLTRRLQRSLYVLRGQTCRTELDMDVLLKNVPGTVYQFLLRSNGSVAFPYASAGVVDIYGFTPEELKHDARKVFSVIHPDDLAAINDSIALSAKKLSTWHAEYRVLLPNKGLRWVKGQSNPIQHPNGDIVWHGYIQDVTDQKMAQQALIDSEFKFKSLFDMLPFSVTLLDAITQLPVEFNTRAYEQLGFTVEAFKQMRIVDYDHLYDQAAVDQVMSGLIDTMSSMEMTTQHKRADDRVIDVALSVQMLELNGSPMLLVISRDITQQLKDKQEQQIILQRLQLATEGANIGIWDYDLITNRLEWDAVMFEHYGINPTDFSNAYEARVSALDPEIMVATNALFQQAIHVTGRYEDVFKIVRGDGSSRWIQALAEVIYDEAGKPVRAIGVNYDITEQKVSMLALEEAKKAAVKASRAKSEFLSNMSHEIRTPMNAIIGLSGLCLTETDSQLIQRRLNQIHRSGLLLLEIINDILDFSKIEAGKLIVEQVPFDMMQNIDHLDSPFSQMARDKDLILNKQIDPSLPCLLVGDSLRMRQVLTNLLGNAIKFTEHGCVTLSAQPEETEAGGQWIRFSVIDTGVGIAADNIQGLFDLFTQADSSITRRFGGTGLGLSISQKLVKAMGGSGIDVESVVGVGSTFSFALPLPAASDEQMQAFISQRADLTLTRVERVSGHVLLVEDNLINQEVAQSMLTQIGLTVDIANNGLEAVERSAEQHYDMILMDIQMPVMDGYEASRRIRQRNVHIPIVALTAAAMIEDRDKAFAAGMNGHLGKPIKRDELASTLHHWLGGASTAQVAPIASEAPLAEPLVGVVSCIDRAALLASLGGDNDLCQRIESQFKQAVHDEYLPLLARLTRLSNSSSDAEWDSLKSQLHSLKGVSSSVTAHAIHALVQEIELLVKSRQVPSAQQLSALADAFATCRG